MRLIIDIPKDTYENAIEGAESGRDETIAIDAIRNSNIIDTTNELHNTIYGMISDDYKERLKAEYQQAKIRLDKLNNYLSKNKDIEDKELLYAQANYMIGYVNILAGRVAYLDNNLD